MQLNMTSIQDAWGVSDLGSVEKENHFQLPRVQQEHLSSHLIPKTDSVSHPNSIVETRPSRIDVAVYCPKAIEMLFPKGPDTRTNIVTDLLRAAFYPKPKPKPKPKPETTSKLTEENKEYFETTDEEQTDNMTLLMLLTFILILLDKLFNIWKNS